jgi:hypothetical protein
MCDSDGYIFQSNWEIAGNNADREIISDTTEAQLTAQMKNLRAEK